MYQSLHLLQNACFPHQRLIAPALNSVIAFNMYWALGLPGICIPLMPFSERMFTHLPFSLPHHLQRKAVMMHMSIG